ncbi:cation diffusion facilitator family transporter [uncultured Pseudokineococcus sp.]|uniref:cation diffusion facilitator family transporter n=1 Tax=uncultured Pseudokineococcus sp. TaxID=1642928 RepID=UPI00262AC390|nr:cation diffusion facilitator family transporter [uncultured Pseudokineococcus sp.]
MTTPGATTREGDEASEDHETREGGGGHEGSASGGHAGSRTAIFAALAANVGIAVTKFVAYLLTSSSAMLAESIHSLADSGNQVLLLVGGARSRRAATPEHPFGFGHERYVYGFVVAVVLFTLGGLFALYEAYEKFQEPEPITAWRWVPVVVLLVAGVMEGLSLRTAVREAGEVRGEQSLPRFVRTARAPELPVVLLEDSAALLGILFALTGVGLTLLTGDGRWDAAGTAAIGLLLTAVAVVLAVEMKSLLVGEGARPAQVRAIEEALPGDGVTGVIHLRTLHLGPEELLVGAKIAVPDAITAAEVAHAIDAAERRVRAAVPIARVIYLEPDLPREPPADGDRPDAPVAG